MQRERMRGEEWEGGFRRAGGRSSAALTRAIDEIVTDGEPATVRPSFAIPRRLISRRKTLGE